MLISSIGSKIKAIREQKNISQAKLANDSKITAGYPCELENGVKNNPSFGVLQKLATALGVKVSDLLEDQAS